MGESEALFVRAAFRVILSIDSRQEGLLLNDEIHMIVIMIDCVQNANFSSQNLSRLCPPRARQG